MLIEHEIKSSIRRKKENEVDAKEKKESFFFFEVNSRTMILGCFLLTIFLGFYFQNGFNGSAKLEDIKQKLSELKKKFSSQNEEFWITILSVLDKKNTTAKCLFLVYNADDKSTCYSLINELAFTYQKYGHFKKNKFKMEKDEMKNLGVLLEHYKQQLKESGVFIFDLTEVSGNTARILHFLLDDNYSQENPPLFIFALKNSEEIVIEKLSRKIQTILENNWKELPENEFYPLISRIVKNVVFVQSEK